jgi:hypothetical protein
MTGNLLITFIGCNLGIYLIYYLFIYYLPKPRSQIFAPIFSPKSFSVLTPTFKCMIYLG